MLVDPGQEKVKSPNFNLRFKVRRKDNNIRKKFIWSRLPDQKITYNVSCEYRIEPVKSKSFKKMSYYRTREFKNKFDKNFTVRFKISDTHVKKISGT